MSRIRVLQVIARMNVGGPAMVITATAKHLDPTCFEQRILTGRVSDDEADWLELRAPDIDVVSVDGLGRSLRAGGDARALATIVAEVRRFRPHIVHTHTAKAGVLGRVGAWLGGAPATVHTFHGHLLRGYFSPPVTAAVRQVERALAARTTRLATEGARVRDELLAAGIGRPEQYVVLPAGVALPEPPPRASARRALNLPVGGLVVAYVARLTGVKRPDRLLAVASRLVKEREDVVFVVAGEGALLDSLRAGAAPLGDRMRFLGWRSDMETVYAAADAVVLTSDNEGMPVSLMEAALVGTPAVTTDVGSTCEVVRHGETGLVTSTEVDDIAGALGRLLDDEPLRRRLGVAAAARAARDFSEERLIADTSALYRSVAEGTPPDRG